MSCYEWERGEIRLPSKDFAKFRREFFSWYNERQKGLLLKAQALYKELKDLSKAKGFDLEKELGHKLTTIRHTSLGGYFGFSPYPVDIDGRRQIEEALTTPRWTRSGRMAERRLKKPTAKDFPTMKLASRKLVLPDSLILFIPESYTIIWSVPESNHACERAYGDPVAAELFGRLNAVEWVRGTGGQIVGNDEYNRDSSEAQGGANYVKQTFGPPSLSRPR